MHLSKKRKSKDCLESSTQNGISTTFEVMRNLKCFTLNS